MVFSELLKQYMKSANLNASQLAEAAGLSVSSVSRYLNGKQMPSDEILHKLATILTYCVETLTKLIKGETVEAPFDEALNALFINTGVQIATIEDYKEVMGL